MAQCSVSMTIAQVIEFGERKWQDICEHQFNQLTAGILNINIDNTEIFRIL